MFCLNVELVASRNGDLNLLKRGLPLVAAWISLFFITAACRSPTRLGASSAGDPSQESRPKVLTTFTILADMARNVAGDRLQVESITKPGAEIHGYEFTPSDIERAAGADLILENGLGLELWARRFTEAAGDVPTVTLTDGIEPLMISEDAYAGRPNPHAWMSPKAAQLYVDRLVDAFSTLDPEGAQQYEANAEAYNCLLYTSPSPRD